MIDAIWSTLLRHIRNYTKFGVPQDSVLGPILYLLYTVNLPANGLATVGTFADDTAVMVSSRNPVGASYLLQKNLNNIFMDGEVEN